MNTQLCELPKQNKVASRINLYIEQSVMHPSRSEIYVWIRHIWLIFYVAVMRGIAVGILTSWTASSVPGTASPNLPTRVSICPPLFLSVSLSRVPFVFTSSVELVSSGEKGKEKGLYLIGRRLNESRSKSRRSISLSFQTKKTRNDIQWRHPNSFFPESLYFFWTFFGAALFLLEKNLRISFGCLWCIEKITQRPKRIFEDF